MYKKKTVFISASSSGIGYYLAQKYKSIGFNVVINGTNLPKLKKVNNTDTMVDAPKLKLPKLKKATSEAKV